MNAKTEISPTGRFSVTIENTTIAPGDRAIVRIDYDDSSLNKDETFKIRLNKRWIYSLVLIDNLHCSGGVIPLKKKSKHQEKDLTCYH